nr:hypothetical protein [Vibrio sp. 04Ya108]
MNMLSNFLTTPVETIDGIKGRKIILGDEVLVYRNLNNLRISIKSNSSNCKGLVLGYADAVRLHSFDPFKVSVAGRERARRDSVRNVHCYAKGTIQSVSVSENELASIKETYACLTYNPFKDNGFVFDDENRELFLPKPMQKYDLVISDGRLYIQEI